MSGILSLILDLALIGLLIAGIGYAMRLTRQLKGLRASRSEMERFVMEFSATVERAEAGIRGLKQAARSGGDDLEQLIEKAQMLRDELHFLVESADKIANRLSNAATNVARTKLSETTVAIETKKPHGAHKPAQVPVPEASQASSLARSAAAKAEKKESFAAGSPSTAEQELLMALKKLG